MKQYLLIAFLLVSGILCGQTTQYDKYTWSAVPEALPNDTVKPVDGAKCTFERRIKEVYINKEDRFEEINVFHKRLKIETHNAIDNSNKIYVPLNNVIEILNIKARFISPGGKITELAQESIKEVKNLENNGDYKIFAIEGIEIGGEIEYFYTLRKKFDAYQSITVQSDEPKENVEVIFAFPSKLEYYIKGYNGFPDFTTETDDKTNITVMRAKADYIPALKEELYADYRANLMRFEYTLAYNSYNSALRTYSWSKVCSNIYTNIYELTGSETKAVNELAKQLELKKGTIEQKIRKVENWVKTEISISESITDTPPLDEIIKNKQTSKYGSSRLTANLLTQLGIPYELVLTTDRTKRKFDPDFNGFNFLDDYLIYFPDLDQYIVPDDPTIRLGVNAINYQGNYGLFMHPFRYNDKLSSLAYRIKKLPVTSWSKSVDSLLVKVVCDFNQVKSNVTIHREMVGILGYSIQSFWESIGDDRHKELINELFEMGDKNTIVQSFKVINGSRPDIGVRPLTFDVNLISNTLIESAGNDFIINIGKTIGTQSELYQTKERKQPVDVQFAHHFYRKIEFSIPKGYKVSNPDDLNMKVEMVENGRVSAYFTSWYELSGNTLYIYSREVYPEIEYPVSSFNQFRDVVNAAADFNKKKLIITPL
jgi:hypothetical protein